MLTRGFANVFGLQSAAKVRRNTQSSGNSTGACLWGHTSDLVPVCLHAVHSSVLDMLGVAGCANVGCCSNNEIPAVY